MFRLFVLFAVLLPLHAATIVLVRHAEKAGPTGDVPLNEAGQRRAVLLAKILADIKYTAIYSTEFSRTRDTVAPLAKAQGLTPVIIAAKDLDGLIAKLKSAAPAENILVVSHSNLVPAIAERLAAKIPAMDETDYSRLIIINTSAAPATLVTLRYGE
jgi:broad specificity phosphatase PhoE